MKTFTQVLDETESTKLGFEGFSRALGNISTSLRRPCPHCGSSSSPSRSSMGKSLFRDKDSLLSELKDQEREKEGGEKKEGKEEERDVVVDDDDLKLRGVHSPQEEREDGVDEMSLEELQERKIFQVPIFIIIYF